MEHPITLSQRLVERWLEEAMKQELVAYALAEYIATKAARWGADQELEACCKWLEHGPFGFSVAANAVPEKLRAARRPKPPSLKQQASESLDAVVECLKMLVPGASVDGVHIETIRRALESLPDPQD